MRSLVRQLLGMPTPLGERGVGREGEVRGATLLDMLSTLINASNAHPARHITLIICLVTRIVGPLWLFAKLYSPTLVLQGL